MTSESVDHGVFRTDNGIANLLDQTLALGLGLGVVAWSHGVSRFLALGLVRLDVRQASITLISVRYQELHDRAVLTDRPCSGSALR